MDLLYVKNGRRSHQHIYKSIPSSASEVCIYRSEEYYRGFITEGRFENGASVLLDDRSLAAEWFTGERLYYGQVT